MPATKNNTKILGFWLGGIVATYLSNLILDWLTQFNAIGWAFNLIISFFLLHFEVYVWQICCCLLFVILCVLGLAKIIKPGFHSFNSLMFKGVKWNWEYKKTRKGYVIDQDSIRAFCPHCDRTLVIYQGELSYDPEVKYSCTHCKKTFIDENVDDSDIRSDLIREVDVRIRKKQFESNEG